MERNKRRRAIELAKDGLIVLLTCSALWLAGQTQLMAPMQSLLREERPQGGSSQSGSGDRVEAALPMAMAVGLPSAGGLPGGERETDRYAVQYDQAGCQVLFQQVAGPMAEALSSAQSPQEISREQWEEALSGTLGVYMDLQGEVPLSVLTGWLAGGSGSADAVVRKLVLAVQDEGVSLYYRNEEDGRYYRCLSEVVDPLSLADTLSGMTGNGAFFAFESEHYGDLDPDTLLFSEAPAPGAYTASNPAAGGQEALEAIVQDLGFPLNSTSFYSADEQVARSGDDSVRLSDRGVALYTAGEDGGRYSVLDQGCGNAMLDRVETCRQLAAAALGGRCGEARLYLISAEAVSGGWEIQFGYSLNGVPVCLEEGYAARFLIRGDKIEQFTLHFRSYVSGGGTSLVLPPRQAAAALAAGGLEGEELLLIYMDNGGDALTASWAARSGSTGEG